MLAVVVTVTFTTAAVLGVTVTVFEEIVQTAPWGTPPQVRATFMESVASIPPMAVIWI